jgi:hypothetical protein
MLSYQVLSNAQFVEAIASLGEYMAQSRGVSFSLMESVAVLTGLEICGLGRYKSKSLIA